MALAGLGHSGEPFGNPFLFAAHGFRIVSARDTDADGIGKPRARLEQVGAAFVDVGVFPVPEDVAAFGVQKHDALRQDIDGFTQPVVRDLCFRNRGLGLRALALDLRDFERNAGCDVALELGAWPPWPQ